MTSRTGTYLTPAHIRDAAIADYHTSGDTLEVVAARHNVGRSTPGTWTRDTSDIAYYGGWAVVRGVQRPLMPEQRSA